jgi:hypothetical protein
MFKWLTKWFKKPKKVVENTAAPRGPHPDLVKHAEYPRSQYKCYFEQHLNFIENKWEGAVHFYGYSEPIHEIYLFTADTKHDLQSKMFKLIRIQMEQYKR